MSRQFFVPPIPSQADLASNQKVKAWLSDCANDFDTARDYLMACDEEWRTQLMDSEPEDDAQSGSIELDDSRSCSPAINAGHTQLPRYLEASGRQPSPTHQIPRPVGLEGSESHLKSEYA